MQIAKGHPANPSLSMKLARIVFLNNFCWVPDSCHREPGRTLCSNLSKKVRVNASFLGVFLDFWWAWGALSKERLPTSPTERLENHRIPHAGRSW